MGVARADDGRIHFESYQVCVRSEISETMGISLRGHHRPREPDNFFCFALTLGGRVMGSRDHYRKFRLIHSMGKGNTRGMYEVDSSNTRQKCQKSRPTLTQHIQHTVFISTRLMNIFTS